MTLTFEQWLDRSDQDRVFLVDVGVIDLNTNEVSTLHFSNWPFYADTYQYIPCISAIPTINRDSGDLEEPGRLPTYGELEFYIRSDFKPDVQNSIPWDLLLFRDSHSFVGQSVTILMGGTNMTLDQFQVIFTGYVGEIPKWGDYYLSLMVFDKLRLLETTIPDFEIPETDVIARDSWGAIPPVPFGLVKNMAPVFLYQPMSNQFKYVVGAGVVNNVQNVYQNSVPVDLAQWDWEQKDISPVFKNADGSFKVATFGPYTGPASVRKWTIEIDDISAGTEVGQATFRWSVDDGVTWEATGHPTWNLAYNPATLVKTVSVGNAVMVISGTYADTAVEAHYEFYISSAGSGTIGSAPYPQIKWRKNGGAWSAGIDLDAMDTPVAFDEGLSFEFSSTQPYIDIVHENGAGTVNVSAVATGGAPLECHLRVSAVNGWECWGYANLGFDVQWYIEPGSDPFNPFNDNTFTVYGLPHTETLTGADINLTFTGYGTTVYKYGSSWRGTCTEDEWSLTPAAGGATVALNDAWEFYCNLQQPIDLGDGVSIQFYTGDGQDFYLVDEASFILWSTITANLSTGDGNAVTCDVEGLLDPDGNYQDEVIPVIKAMLRTFCGWEDSDFDLATMATMAAEFPVVIGYLVDDVTTVGEALASMLTGFPCLYSVDLGDRFYIKELAVPAGTPDLTLVDARHDFTDLPEGSMPEQLPKKRIFIKYDKNWSVNDNPVNTSVDFGIWVQKEYRQVAARDRRILDMYRAAGDMGPLETFVVDRDDAQGLADRLLAIFKDPRGYLRVQCTPKAAMVKPGDIVTVFRDKFGMDAGLTYMVSGTDFDPLSDTWRLTLWR